jgi:hypothetical protein
MISVGRHRRDDCTACAIISEEKMPFSSSTCTRGSAQADGLLFHSVVRSNRQVALPQHDVCRA